MTGETRRRDQQPSGQHGNGGAKTMTETEELKLNENVYIQFQHTPRQTCERKSGRLLLPHET